MEVWSWVKKEAVKTLYLVKIPEKYVFQHCIPPKIGFQMVSLKWHFALKWPEVRESELGGGWMSLPTYIRRHHVQNLPLLVILEQNVTSVTSIKLIFWVEIHPPFFNFRTFLLNKVFSPDFSHFWSYFIWVTSRKATFLFFLIKVPCLEVL